MDISFTATQHSVSERRLFFALVLAPWMAVVTLSALGALHSIRNGHPVGAALYGASHASFFFAFFGLPIAYVAELVLVLLLLATGRRANTLRVRDVMLPTAVAGLLVMPLVCQIFFGGFDWICLFGGAAMGAASGATFLGLLGRPSKSRGAI